MRMKNKTNLLIKSLLLSYSQIFFSDKLLFGLLLLLVSFFNLSAGLAGLLAIVISNATAWLMGINRQKIASGQYGFNSLLVGLGLGIYYQFNLVLFLVIFFASLLTFFLTLLFEGWLGKYKLPFLSLSFLFGIWLVTLSARQFTGLQVSEYGIFHYNDIVNNTSTGVLNMHKYISSLAIPRSLKVYFNSLGAIFFQYNIYAGILIALGLLFTSRISFTLSLIGFYAAYFYYWIVGADFSELSYSYIGFNFILTAIAVGGFFVIPSFYSYLWVILLTPLISFIMTSTGAVLGLFGLSTFALPFNITVILFLYALEFRERHFDKPLLVSVQNFSPEKNLYSHTTYSRRFGDKPLIAICLPFFGNWKVAQGHSGDFTHKGQWKHAWDFVIETDGKEFSGNGSEPEDYYCYNKAVVAPAAGVVEAVNDGIEDNKIGEVNLDQNWGNSIVIRHATYLYSQVSHLKAGSIQVEKGDVVKKGEVIGYVGNSGRSPSPHLHFQLQATPFVGSQTIEYPVNLFTAEKDGKRKLMINGIPQQDSFVENIKADKSLERGFGFISGQKIKFESENEKINWEVGIDYYNNTWLYDSESNSYAFFRKTDGDLVFTGFKGNKKSRLFLFYLAAYHVIFSYEDDMQVNDILPANTFGEGPRKWLQDFAAPFYIFIKPEYRITYVSRDLYFDESNIKLKSQVSEKSKTAYSFDFELDNKGISVWKIKTKQESVTFKAFV